MIDMILKKTIHSNMQIRSMYILCIFILTCVYTTNETLPQQYVIIVPGTWSMRESWYTLGEDFFNELNHTAHTYGKKVIWWRWLSYNQETYRKKGAQELAYIIDTLDAHIDIVAHSHGATIALGASQLLNHMKSTKKIHTLYTLGAPIDTDMYSPHMTHIEKIYNFYSLNDEIQTCYGWKRIFNEHPRIYNIHTFIQNKEPSHQEMHDPIIGKWILHIPQKLHHHKSIVHFSNDIPPQIEPDTMCDEKLSYDNDQPINLATLFDSRNVPIHENVDENSSRRSAT
jgi:hypothetical protein